MFKTIIKKPCELCRWESYSELCINRKPLLDSIIKIDKLRYKKCFYFIRKCLCGKCIRKHHAKGMCSMHYKREMKLKKINKGARNVWF